MESKTNARVWRPSSLIFVEESKEHAEDEMDFHLYNSEISRVIEQKEEVQVPKRKAKSSPLVFSQHIWENKGKREESPLFLRNFEIIKKVHNVEATLSTGVEQKPSQSKFRIWDQSHQLSEQLNPTTKKCQNSPIIKGMDSPNSISTCHSFSGDSMGLEVVDRRNLIQEFEKCQNSSNSQNLQNNPTCTYNIVAKKQRKSIHKAESTMKSHEDVYKINLDNVLRGKDKRTTIMIRNIPNKYSIHVFLEDLNAEFKDKFDVFYLPIDYKNKCNLGFAFINFVDSMHILQFYESFRGKKWRRFNSDKICELAYAKFQGKKELISHYEKGVVMNFNTMEKKPLILNTPEQLPPIEIPLKYYETFTLFYPYSDFFILKSKFIVNSLFSF